MDQSGTNTERFRSAFFQLHQGDATAFKALCAANICWMGWDAAGAQVVMDYASLFQESGTNMAQWDEVHREVIEVIPVGDEIIMCRMLGRQRQAEMSVEFDYAVMARFTDGLITHAADIFPSSYEQFCARGLRGR